VIKIDIIQNLIALAVALGLCVLAVWGIVHLNPYASVVGIIGEVAWLKIATK